MAGIFFPTPLPQLPSATSPAPHCACCPGPSSTPCLGQTTPFPRDLCPRPPPPPTSSHPHPPYPHGTWFTHHPQQPPYTPRWFPSEPTPALLGTYHPRQKKKRKRHPHSSVAGRTELGRGPGAHTWDRIAPMRRTTTHLWTLRWFTFPPPQDWVGLHSASQTFPLPFPCLPLPFPLAPTPSPPPRPFPQTPQVGNKLHWNKRVALWWYGRTRNIPGIPRFDRQHHLIPRIATSVFFWLLRGVSGCCTHPRATLHCYTSTCSWDCLYSTHLPLVTIYLSGTPPLYHGCSLHTCTHSTYTLPHATAHSTFHLWADSCT